MTESIFSDHNASWNRSLLLRTLLSCQAVDTFVLLDSNFLFTKKAIRTDDVLILMIESSMDRNCKYTIFLFDLLICRAEKWYLPRSRPISPMEQLNLLAKLDAENSHHAPEAKKEEVEVSQMIFAISTIVFIGAFSAIGIIFGIASKPEWSPHHRPINSLDSVLVSIRNVFVRRFNRCTKN